MGASRPILGRAPTARCWRLKTRCEPPITEPPQVVSAPLPGDTYADRSPSAHLRLPVVPLILGVLIAAVAAGQRLAQRYAVEQQEFAEALQMRQRGRGERAARAPPRPLQGAQRRPRPRARQRGAGGGRADARRRGRGRWWVGRAAPESG